MLYIRDKIMKLGGKIIGGEVASVEIQETAGIYEATDDKGRIKKTQAVGYENSKVNVTIVLEDMKGKTCLQQMQEMEKLFRATKQKVPKMMKIVNEDCAARGINKVYFKDFTTKNIISESKRTATIELLVPGTAKLHVLKKASGSQKTSSKKNSSKKKNKSKKSSSKSPAKDTRNSSSAKKKAKKLVK